jgi:hypothetical protein
MGRAVLEPEAQSVGGAGWQLCTHAVQVEVACGSSWRCRAEVANWCGRKPVFGPWTVWTHVAPRHCLSAALCTASVVLRTASVKWAKTLLHLDILFLCFTLHCFRCTVSVQWARRTSCCTSTLFVCCTIYASLLCCFSSSVQGTNVAPQHCWCVVLSAALLLLLQLSGPGHRHRCTPLLCTFHG